MSTGLILRRSGRVESGELWLGHACQGSERIPFGGTVCDDEEVALSYFVRRAKAVGLELDWVVGEGLTKRVCRRFGLEHRLRAPGAGRKRLGEGETKVQRSYWLTRAGVDAIAQAAARSGRALGEEIESRFLSDNQ